jgi:hypothetical protein
MMEVGAGQLLIHSPARLTVVGPRREATDHRCGPAFGQPGPVTINAITYAIGSDNSAPRVAKSACRRIAADEASD